MSKSKPEIGRHTTDMSQIKYHFFVDRSCGHATSACPFPRGCPHFYTFSRSTLRALIRTVPTDCYRLLRQPRKERA